MDNRRFYLAGHTPALQYASQALMEQGCVLASRPDHSVTHLLLPVPSFEPDGTIKGGGTLSDLLSHLSQSVVIMGGSLDRPELEAYSCIDLLKDPLYTARNANITAHCALRLAMNKLSATMEGLQVLVIGWGRIGKCLARLLKTIGAEVTVAARKENDRAMLSALGFRALDTCNLDTAAYRVVFNTVPHMLCPQSPGDGLKIDLASNLGLGSLDVLWARGLPGKDAPESSGQLIAQTVLRLSCGKE